MENDMGKVATKYTKTRTVSYNDVLFDVYEIRTGGPKSLRMVVMCEAGLESNYKIKVIKGDGRLEAGFFLYEIQRNATQDDVDETLERLEDGFYATATPIDRTLGY
jgi:hypothetical protein